VLQSRAIYDSDTYTQCQACNEHSLRSLPTVPQPHRSDAAVLRATSADGHELLYTKIQHLRRRHVTKADRKSCGTECEADECGFSRFFSGSNFWWILVWCTAISTGLTWLSTSSIKSSLPHYYRASVSRCRLRSGLRDGTQIRRLCFATGYQLVVPLHHLNLWPSGILCTWCETVEVSASLLHDTGHSIYHFICHLKPQIVG